jgi:two-component system response regulator RegA
MSAAPTILVVDDDVVWRQRLSRALVDRGYEVTSAGDVDDALRKVDPAPDSAVVDLRMPGRSGLDLLRALSGLSPRPRVLVLTGYGAIPTAIEATRLGAVGYLSKPADVDEILQALVGASPGGPRAPSEAEAAHETPTLARIEWEHLHRVLGDCGHSISEAARRLGLHRRSLQRKLQKHPPAR